METKHLKDSQLEDYWVEGYGYGLGVRCPKDATKTDFGQDGAAGSHALIDRRNGITAFYAQHVLDSPTQISLREIALIIKKVFMKNSIA